MAAEGGSHVLHHLRSAQQINIWTAIGWLEEGFRPHIMACLQLTKSFFLTGFFSCKSFVTEAALRDEQQEGQMAVIFNWLASCQVESGPVFCHPNPSKIVSLKDEDSLWHVHFFSPLRQYYSRPCIGPVPPRLHPWFDKVEVVVCVVSAVEIYYVNNLWRNTTIVHL